LSYKKPPWPLLSPAPMPVTAINFWFCCCPIAAMTLLDPRENTLIGFLVGEIPMQTQMASCPAVTALTDAMSRMLPSTTINRGSVMLILAGLRT